MKQKNKQKKKQKALKNAIGYEYNPYTLESSLKMVAFKVYDEQIPKGVEELTARIKATNKEEYEIMMIKHDRDFAGDDFYKPSTEKAHYHILVRKMKGNKVGNSVKLRTILKKIGIVFRKGIDDKMRINHGIEGIVKYDAYATYLTHDTPQAIRDGKAHYELEEIVSNLSIDEIENIREGYHRNHTITKITDCEMEMLDNEAHDLGYKLENFEKWYFALPVKIRANARMKEIEKHYYQGVKERYDEDRTVNRLCIFIQGDPAVGKTYTTNKTIKEMGIVPIHLVDGGGTGKFDDLQCYTQSMIMDDFTSENMLNFCDNKFCKAYRRNRNNPIWTGKLLVVTSNKTFDEWLDACRITNKKERDAMRTRFYICKIEKIDNKNQLICNPELASKRGTIKEQEERLQLFMEFSKRFNCSLLEYQPQAQTNIYQVLKYMNTDEPCKVGIKRPTACEICKKMECAWS